LLTESETEAVKLLCRQLPQLGHFMASVDGSELQREWPRELVLEAARRVLARMREQARTGAHTQQSLHAEIDGLAASVAQELKEMTRPSLRRVMNATGVILQTNLGRAPLSEAAIRRIEETARGYCNLEFDLATGERGRRDAHVEELILRVLALRSGQPFGKERAATVVNNCAAATFLALNTLAEGGEVLVSCGELLEIGGGFRIPDILRKSGAILHEVGTTNRTRIADYASAITPQTRLILRVHRSNFRIEGFTEQPDLRELMALGAEAAVPVFEDQGTGCIVQLEDFGIHDEANWARDAACGPALVSASGDKLLGGPQCGILVGERNLIERIRANPLARAFRPDKLTCAALEATLLAYLMGAEETIPAIAMLKTSADDLRRRCAALEEKLRRAGFEAETITTRSLVGGGTAPGASLPSFAVALRQAGPSEEELAAALRSLDPPVIARIAQGRVLLDLRTVSERDDEILFETVSKLGS
jgi:L-seryl-tRNA(Ser) seleniumtransferase